MSAGDLFAWWNLCYVLPLLIAVVYLLVLLTTGLAESGHAGHDAEGHVEGHVDHHLEAHVDHAAEVDAHADHDHDADAHAEHETEVNWFDPLVLLGANKLPLSIALELFCLFWGGLGLSFNTLLSRWLHDPRWFIGPSLVLTFVATAIMSRLVSTGLARVMPKIESNAIAAGQLVGLLGETVYTVQAERGSVMVKSPSIGVIEVACRTLPGDEPIPRGRAVVLVEYDEDGGFYLATPVSDLDPEA